MSKRNKALAAIIACVLFWGFSFISIKITVVVFPPMSLGMLRFAIALVFLFFIKLKLAPAEKLRSRDIPLLLGAGVSGVTLYFFFENNGVSLVTASEASIAIGAIPVLIMVADWLSRKAGGGKNNHFPQLGLRQWMGAFISIAGVWLVAGVSFALSGSVLGYIYMTGAALSWVVYSLLTRPLFVRCSRIYIVFWQTVAGFFCFIPFSILEFSRWGRPDLPVIFHLIFLGICCSALGYMLYAHSLEVLGMSVSAIFINLIPLLTVIFGFFVVHDRLTLLQWCGAALVIGGVYLSMGVKRAKG
jgi:drug/metabolite transporter (DMT)-like permease